MLTKTNRRLVFLLSTSLLLTMAIVPVARAQTQTQTEDLSDPNNLRPLTQEDSLLSLPGGQRLMREAAEAINKQNYELASSKLQQARQIFNQLSNFYLQLANSFSGIENRISEAQKRKALETGQMRDEATYQLALVHRAMNQPELSVPLLIQVIRSQNPTSELGKKAYQQLFEIGFVDTPFSTANTSSGNSTNQNQPNK
jgi:cell division septum initiation protein DivIVA